MGRNLIEYCSYYQHARYSHLFWPFILAIHVENKPYALWAITLISGNEKRWLFKEIICNGVTASIVAFWIERKN